MIKRLAVPSLLVLCLLPAACGSDDDEGGGGGGGGGAAQTDTGGGGTAVSMKNIAFNPQTINVQAGDTVTWTNDEATAHDVTAKDDSFKSGPSGGMQQGDTFEHTFDQAGTVEYVCTVHPTMTGTVEVASGGGGKKKKKKSKSKKRR